LETEARDDSDEKLHSHNFLPQKILVK